MSLDIFRVADKIEESFEKEIRSVKMSKNFKKMLKNGNWLCYNRNRLKKGGIKMKQLRKTKIVGTIGPASENKLEELFEAGLNVTRVNYSKGYNRLKGR